MGVSARLLGASVIPVAVLAAVLGASVVDHHRSVRLAESVADRVVVLEQMVTLRSALFEEQVAVEVFNPRRRPLEALLSNSAFGAQISERPEQLSERTDAALAAIAAGDRPFGKDDLDSARRASLSAPLTAGSTSTAFDEIGQALELRIADDLRVVREAAVELGDVPLIRAGTVFQRSVELPEQAGVLVAALADLWIAAPAERPALQSKVVMAFADYEGLSERFADSIVDDSSTVARAASPVLLVPPGLEPSINASVSGELSAAARPPGLPIAVGAALREGVDWILEVDAVRTDAAEAVTAAARELAAEARASERWRAALALGVVAIAIAAAVLFGRSIARPVRRLTDRAERIGSGQLDEEVTELRGPPEVVRASQALDDVVDNLDLLERKGLALARADFEDPSLHRPLPGRLGASLQLSMEVLADSIEQREALQSRLRFEALHDSLTGLGNRASLIDTLHRALGSTTASVVFLDLNDFKGINDRHGHAAGDEVLREVAIRLSSAAPARALVARLGGDEFVIALPGTGSMDEAVEVARRAVHTVARPMEIGGRVLEIGASAGVALSDHGSGDAGVEALLRMADLAVYSAKHDPNDTVAVYDDELDRRLTHQRLLEASLARALEPGRGELRLHVQPIVAAEDFAVVGVEALLRWDTPTGTSIAPHEFIPIAERSDLILDVDRWVIEHVLELMASWQAEPTTASLSVSVNVSGRSLLDRTFVDRVAAALASSGVRPSCLHLEVTETAIVSDLELAAAQLAQLRSLGVRVVIDDFGTGYTSIAHLRTLPVDELKIDGSFVAGMAHEADDHALIEMIHHVAHQLHVPTVAEGVETAEQIDLLRRIGCDRLQGYYFSPPMEADRLPTWLGDRAGASSATR